MPFVSRKAKLRLSDEEKTRLGELSRSRAEEHARVIRAGILLAFEAGEGISAIARRLGTNRAKVDRCVRKGLSQGVDAALADLPRPGRPREIGDDARAWVVDLACRKPTELGYAAELWTYSALAQHARRHALAAGFSKLARAGKALVFGILKAHAVRPHKIRYFLEARDPDFETKKAQILVVYKEVALLNESGQARERTTTTVCVDEKPGIQALSATRADRPPEPGRRGHWGRDHEYVRRGTLRLLSGIDLHTGRVWGLVRDRNRSREFIELLELLHESYPEDWKIRVVLDNHSSHTSKETQRHLATRPNRFEFVFTPKHGSWLNLIEVFFSKMTRSFLRGLRVGSKDELRARIEQYLEEVNLEPVVFRWKYQLEETGV